MIDVITNFLGPHKKKLKEKIKIKTKNNYSGE
jgi:hypothetical protein